MTRRHWLLLAFAAMCPVLLAREFRLFEPIPTPQKQPKGRTPVKEIQPVETEAVKQAVRDLVAAWNTPEIGDKLGGQFYDKERLLDSFAERVPRDADLRVLGIRNVQVMQQYMQSNPNGGAARTSIVSVAALTQIEFNHPTDGFQRIEGVNELIFEVTPE